MATGHLREPVFKRCQGYCEYCGKTLDASWALHHRQLRSRGGKDVIFNLAALCHECHNLGTDSVHMQVQKSTATGHIVSTYENPLEVPMRLPDGTWVLLTPEGEYHILKEENDES